MAGMAMLTFKFRHSRAVEVDLVIVLRYSKIRRLRWTKAQEIGREDGTCFQYLEDWYENSTLA
jgi:hypothetical protein